MLQVRIKTDVVSEPLSLAEVQDFIGVDFKDHDVLITNLIKSSRIWCEQYCSAVFSKKVLEAYWVRMPDNGVLRLPQGPHISVDAVNRIDEEQTATALTLNSDYYVRGLYDKEVTFNSSWSESAISTTNYAYKVEYTTGYGETQTETLPSNIKVAMLKLVAENYKNRENTVTGTIIQKVPDGVKSLLNPFRRKIWI